MDSKIQKKPKGVIEMYKQKEEELEQKRLASLNEYVYVFEYIISLFYPDGARLIHSFRELTDEDMHFVMERLKDDSEINRKIYAVEIAKYITRNNSDFNKCLFLLYGKRREKLETLKSFDHNAIYNLLDRNHLDGFSSTYVKIERENYYGGFDIMMPYFQSHLSFMKMKKYSYEKLVDNIKFENHAMRVYQNYDETYLSPK